MTIPKSDPFDLVGTTVAGKYDVEEVVAQTVLSVVYRATHRVWQRSVAIKAFAAPLLSDEARQQLLASFVEEGRLLMDLSERCASICQARDVASLTTAAGDWVPYTVLEWLDGECLEGVLLRERAASTRPRTVAEGIELLNPIAHALAVAHERGVVHRDVKPGNIFVLAERDGRTPRCKLLDFGVAKVMRGAAAATREQVCQSFTPTYAAPEQFFATYGTTGPWTDVFALALIVVELIVGHEVWLCKPIEVLAALSCDPDARPTPAMFGVNVSDEVERVLRRALAVRLEERHPDARSFWDALVAAAAHEENPELEVTWDLAEERRDDRAAMALTAEEATGVDVPPGIEVDPRARPQIPDGELEGSSGSPRPRLADLIHGIPIGSQPRRDNAPLP